MIPSELATQALAIISPLLVKGGETLMQGVGKDLWEGVKSLFKRENKQAVIEKLEKEPQSEQVKEEVKANLTAMLYDDEVMRSKMEKLVTSYQQGANINISGVTSKSVIGGNDITGNTITIS